MVCHFSHLARFLEKPLFYYYYSIVSLTVGLEYKTEMIIKS